MNFSETKESFTDIIKEDEGKMVLVDFYADWCEPCKWLDVILKEIGPVLENEVLIVKVDSEKNIQTSAHFDIKSVPVLILFKNSEPVWRINGFLTADQMIEKIRSFID